MNYIYLLGYVTEISYNYNNIPGHGNDFMLTL